MPYQEIPHFETPPKCFKTPPKCKKIWRYMPIDKFMAMLSEESLYFPNVYLFNDRYEGPLSNKSREEVYKTNLLDEKNTPIEQDEEFTRQKDNIKSLKSDIKKGLKLLHSFETLLKDFSNHLMFCSSWFLRENESLKCHRLFRPKFRKVKRRFFVENP